MPGGRGLMVVLSAGLLGACASDTGRPETAARALERDITLQAAAAPVVQVASAVELGRPEPMERTVPRRKTTPRPAPAPVPEAAGEAAPDPEPVSVPAPAAAAEATRPEPAPTGRELAPGQTVTVLPASSGATSQGPDEVYLPLEPGRGIKAGGGHCPTPPRRGRPVGIVGFR